MAVFQRDFSVSAQSVDRGPDQVSTDMGGGLVCKGTAEKIDGAKPN